MEIEQRKELIFSLRQQIFTLFDSLSKQSAKKNDRDIVTNVDQEIEDLLMYSIQEKFPNDHIISEETGGTKGNNEFMWYLDPIDGTGNFARGLPWYGMSAGLVQDGEIVLGILFSGEDKKVYWAVKGKGAYCEDELLPGVSSTENLINSTVSFCLNYDNVEGKKDLHMLSDLYHQVQAYKHITCPVIEMIYVAKGILDGSWNGRYISPWDYVAGALLVTEAGGQVSHEDGPLTFEKKKFFFASNGKIHTEFVETVMGLQ
jgi:myo-inositol-1(or 4)-monophosphatase